MLQKLKFFIKKYSGRNKLAGLSVLLILVFAFMVGASKAFAAPAETCGTSCKVTSEIMGWTIGWLIQAIGWLLGSLVYLMIKVAGYNGFINELPVTMGWVIVRDIANMF